MRTVARGWGKILTKYKTGSASTRPICNCTGAQGMIKSKFSICSLAITKKGKGQHGMQVTDAEFAPSNKLCRITFEKGYQI